MHLLQGYLCVEHFLILEDKTIISLREFKILSNRDKYTQGGRDSGGPILRKNLRHACYVVVFILMNCYSQSLVQGGVSWYKTTTTLEYAGFYFLYQTAGFKLTDLFSSPALWPLDRGLLKPGSLHWIEKSQQGGYCNSNVFFQAII